MSFEATVDFWKPSARSGRMRIVAGKYRRRRLLSKSGLGTRPIPDRVKELLFARFEADLPETCVADIFAGTGTIGLEAMSRGARSVVFIEKDRRAFELLRRNVEHVGVQQQVVCWRTDALRCSFRPKGAENRLPYDLLFVDPPFSMIEQLVPTGRLYRPLQRIARPAVTSPTARLVLRTPRRAVFQMPPEWEGMQTIELSNMEIHVFRKSSLEP